MKRLEFWPDYGGVLLHEDGALVALDRLDLPSGLMDRAARWLARYDDARLEPGSRDDAWITEGRALFVELQSALAPRSIELVDWEGYWAGDERIA